MLKLKSSEVDIGLGKGGGIFFKNIFQSLNVFISKGYIYFYMDFWQAILKIKQQNLWWQEISLINIFPFHLEVLLKKNKTSTLPRRW